MLPFLKRIGGPRIVVPGSQSYTTPGTYTFNVPAFNTLTVTVNAGGGGGGGYSNGHPEMYNGGNGGNSSFASVSAEGGLGGAVCVALYSDIHNQFPNGSPGGSSGGDSNFTGTGGAGGQGYKSASYDLGSDSYAYGDAGYGGAGGRSVKTYIAGALGATVTVVVGAGGAAGGVANTAGITQYPTAGANGAVLISWS